MSSLNDVLNIATSGLSTAQSQITVTSNNITNVNTPGYTREVVTQSPIVVEGRGLGVQIDSIQSAANTFLDKASQLATAQSGQTSVISSFLDQAQQMFGDPSSSTSFFSGLDNLYSALSSASDTPSSSLSRSGVLNAVNTFLTSANSLSTNLSGLRDQANQQTTADVAQVNQILSQISQTDADIARIGVSGGDTSGLTNSLSQLQTKLSGLMNVSISPDGTGGVTVRSQDGVYLTGQQGASTVNFSVVGGGGLMTATPPKGQPMQVTPGGGEIGGLVQLAGVQLPQIMSQLSEFVSQAVSQINAAHNDASAVPAPNQLTGTQIGMDLPTAIAGFSGKSTVAITNSAGVMQQRLDIDFGAGQINITDNTGATSTVAFTPANFLTTLNAALGTEGSASFTNGQLSIAAPNSSDGVAIADDPTTPSSNAGQNFGQFFGLNNLIQSSTYANVNGSLSAASPSTFAAGGSLNLELVDSNGSAVRQVNLTIPSGAATVGDLINSLNSTIGSYGSFALDAQGHLAFTPTKGYTGTTVSVISDNTTNTSGGASLSQMLGVGWTTQAARTSSFSIRSDIAANPNLLSLAQLDLSQTVNGQPALAVGDGRGAVAMANSASNTVTFSAAGAMKSLATSVSNYGSQLAGQIGAMATNAGDQDQASTALLNQATAQRSSAEGVNLDSELVNLTTFQQSYNASARLIQAVQEMYTTLMQMV
ncbi:MAG TPA: flagellar hook-associated protein FlgK [Caulobacteraceae bacterium]|jgi:flagellar hook-associated protein 1 FlgK